MSAEAMGWVFKHSPFTGATLLVHLAVADAANDLNGNELWARQAEIGRKVRVGRQSVNGAMRELEDGGFLTLLADNSRTGKANRYRFETPMVPVVYGVSSEATPPRRVSALATQGVVRGDTEPKRTQAGELSSERTPPPARRDLVFEAVAEVCGIEWRGGALTTSARGPLTRAVKELKQVGAEPDEVRARARRYVARFPGAALTPMALTKHWSALTGTHASVGAATMNPADPSYVPPYLR